MKGKCRDCYFWDDKNPPTHIKAGLCRKNAPRPKVETEIVPLLKEYWFDNPKKESVESGDYRMAMWPLVSEEDWCGEFKIDILIKHEGKSDTTNTYVISYDKKNPKKPY